LKCEGQVISYHQIITYRIKLMHINNKGVSPLNNNGWSLTWSLGHFVTLPNRNVPHTVRHIALGCLRYIWIIMQRILTTYNLFSTATALIHKPEEITFRSSVYLIIVKNYLILI
jgi:hypothetical protein